MTIDRFHIVVFCWSGVMDNVLEICRQLEHFECRKTVIDASGAGTRIVAGWEWVGIDPRAYYGGQFEFALRLVTADVLLAIIGDMECDDWVAAASVCIERFAAFPYIGVWSAEVDNTEWRTERTSARIIRDNEMHAVSQTDCCVWAMRQQVIERLTKMDFSMNNLGWGIDWAAMVACYSNGLIAVRDKRVSIHHPVGSGYQRVEAGRQMDLFLNQLTISEKALYSILCKSVR